MKRMIGVTPQKVYDKIAMMPLEHKKGMLWSYLGKRGAMSLNTETAILEVLKGLYQESFQSYDPSTFGVLKDFVTKLAQHGYADLAERTNKEAASYLNKSIDAQAPNRNSFERYETHRSYFGCGYEDSTTSYHGFDREAFAKAWEAHRGKEGLMRSILEKKLEIGNTNVGYDSQINLTPFGKDKPFHAHYQRDGASFKESARHALGRGDPSMLENAIRTSNRNPNGPGESYISWDTPAVRYLGSALDTDRFKAGKPHKRDKDAKLSSYQTELIDKTLKAYQQFFAAHKEQGMPLVKKLAKQGNFLEIKRFYSDAASYMHEQGWIDEMPDLEVVCDRLGERVFPQRRGYW